MEEIRTAVALAVAVGGYGFIWWMILEEVKWRREIVRQIIANIKSRPHRVIYTDSACTATSETLKPGSKITN